MSQPGSGTEHTQGSSFTASSSNRADSRRYEQAYGRQHASTSPNGARANVRAPKPAQSNQAQEKSYQDFEKLCKSIESTIGNITRIAAQGLGEAGAAVGDALNQAISSAQAGAQEGRKRATQGANEPNGQGTYSFLRQNARQELARNQQKALEKARFKPSGPTKAAGIVLTSFGGLFTLGFASSTVGSLSGLVLTGGAALASAATGLVCTALSAWMLAAGISRIQLANYMKQIRGILGKREVVTFQELSLQLGISQAKASSIARKMIKRGMFREGHIDDEGTCLIVTNAAYGQYRQAKEAYLERKRAEQREAKQSAQAQIIDVQPGLTEEQRAFKEEGESYLAKFRELDESIDDDAVSQRIRAIEDTLSRIIQRVMDSPQAISSLDRLLDYYLPTTVKLLSAYDGLEKETIQGENIMRSRAEIEHTLDVLEGAYQKLLDSTYQDLSFDVSADISVLNTFLAQDGLTEDPFKKSTEG